MNDSMAVTAMVHLYGKERPYVHYINGFVSVNVGSAHVMFMKPEALAGFLLAIAESPEAQQYLAQAGAGFHLDVEPLPQPGVCRRCDAAAPLLGGICGTCGDDLRMEAFTEGMGR